MTVRLSGFRWVLVVACVHWIGCSDEPATSSADSSGSGGNRSTVMAPPIMQTPDSAPDALSAEELIDAGRSAYNANCMACHGLDPTKDGALGPAVAGSSLALLEARVLRAEYPEAYEPKRATRVMIPLPHLAPRLVELTAYLKSLE